MVLLTDFSLPNSAFFAEVMANVLAEASERSCLLVSDIPRGVLIEAKNFLLAVVQGFWGIPTESFLYASSVVNDMKDFSEESKSFLFPCGVGMIIGLDQGKIDSQKAMPTIGFMSKFFFKLAKLAKEREKAAFANDPDDE